MIARDRIVYIVVRPPTVTRVGSAVAAFFDRADAKRFVGRAKYDIKAVIAPKTHKIA